MGKPVCLPTLPWGDIEARLSCDLPPRRATLADSLRLGASRVLCRNVSGARTSAATYRYRYRYAGLAALGKEP